MARGTPSDRTRVVLPFRPADAPNAGPNPGLAGRVDVTTLELRYRYRQSYDDHLAGCVQEWEFDAHAHLDDPTTAVGAVDLDDDTMVLVGRGEALLVDLHAERNPVDALDEHSETAKEIAEIVFDPATGELRRDLSDDLEGLGGHLLVLLDVEVVPNWQGRRLSTLIAGFAIAALSPGALAVVCRPEPHDLTGPVPAGEDPAERAAVTAALQRQATSLGFTPYRSGVYHLDTALVAFPEAFSRLLHIAATGSPPSSPLP